MIKEFKIIIAENEDDMMSVEITSTGWNSLELDGIRSRLPRLIDEALTEKHTVVEDETKCACGENTQCECEPAEDVIDMQLRLVKELAWKLNKTDEK